MSRSSPASGFTLIELLIVIMIVAILVAVAFPNFEATLRSNRLVTRNNELLASLSLARSEAIKNNLGAGICATSDGGLTCGTDWNAGWVIWGELGVDDNTPQAIEILRVVEAQPKLAMRSLGGLDQINFTPRGLVETTDIATGATAQYEMQAASCTAGTPFRRNLSINHTGQLRSAKGACS